MSKSYVKIGCLFLFILIGTRDIFIVKSEPVIIDDVDTIVPIEDTVIRINTNYKVLATKYNAVESQCDADPLITADCSKIDLDKLNNYELRWIAISRDLKEFFKFGDTVIINCDNPDLCGAWEVHDVMTKRFTMKIDFLVPENDNYNFNRPMEVEICKL